MLLCDRDLIALLRTGDLVVRPLGPDAMQPASIDVRLGRKLLVTTPWGDMGREYDLITEGAFMLQEGYFVLGATLEWIEIPPTHAGIIVGKSSRAREGLVIEDAGYIDPGWKGEITLELSNRSPVPFRLEYEMPIGQLRIEMLSGRAIRPYGSDGLGSHYQGSAGPIPSRAGKEVST